MNDPIKAFENMEPIQASAGWDQQLFNRINTTSTRPVITKSGAISVVLILAVLVINSLLIFTGGNEHQLRQDERTNILNTVSEELLINSTAQN